MGKSRKEIIELMKIWYDYQAKAHSKNNYNLFRLCEKELEKLRNLL